MGHSSSVISDKELSDCTYIEVTGRYKIEIENLKRRFMDEYRREEYSGGDRPPTNPSRKTSNGLVVAIIVIILIIIGVLIWRNFTNNSSSSDESSSASSTPTETQEQNEDVLSPTIPASSPTANTGFTAVPAY